MRQPILQARVPGKRFTVSSEQQDTKRELWWLTCIFLSVVVEGALRKWVLPGVFHPAAFFAKDIIALFYILDHRGSKKNKYTRNLMLIATGAALMLSVAFILGLRQSWQSAIITYKNAVLWPFIASSIMVNCPKATWKNFSLVVALTAALIFALGVEQFFSDPSDAINNYAWTPAGVASSAATFGGLGSVRATGSFSYITGMADFAVFGYLICLFFVFESTLKLEKIWLICGCAASIGCAVVSGSRSPLVFMALATIIFAVNNVGAASKFVGICLYCAVGIGIALLLINNQMISEYFGRWTRDPDETLRRFTGEGFRSDYARMIWTDPVGIGLGQGHGYAVFERSRTNSASFSSEYDESASLAVYEGGLLGGLAFCLAPVVLGLQLLRGLVNRNRRVRSISAVLGTAPVLLLIGGVWHDHNATAFVWLLVAAWLGLVGGALESQTGERVPSSRILSRWRRT